jgi:hypothetical protein
MKTAAVIASAASMAPVTAGLAATPPKPGREFYELRGYTLKDKDQQKLVEDYFSDALIPAFIRAGGGRVGVFTELKPEGQTALFALLPYNSYEDFELMQEKLAMDKVYLQSADAYLNAPAIDPAYTRISSSLLKSFVHMPKMQVPEKKPRIFELRRYEHATEGAGQKKLEMFNDAGEIDIFKRLGFRPVFFGETLVGEQRPNLIYMLTFDDMAAHDAHWGAFGNDTEWLKLKANPDYADAKLVSNITSIMLTPAACSLI